MSETAVLILAATVAAVFGVALFGIVSSARRVRSYARERDARLKGLRIHRMLERIGIRLPRYLRASDPLTVEKQLLICEHCGTTHACDQYLVGGKDIDPRGFCPNFEEFQELKRRT